MQREIRTLAAALAGEFGTAQRVADEVRMHVRRARLVRARGIYFPPADGRPHAALLLSRDVLEDERRVLLTRAVAHVFLRHRARGSYSYGPRGPLYDAPRDWLEVELFAEAFAARSRPALRLVSDRRPGQLCQDSRRRHPRAQLSEVRSLARRGA